MPGFPTKVVIADRVFDRLRLQGGPEAALLGSGDLLSFAYLGALGPDFGDLLPARPDAGASGASNSPYFQAWRPILRMFAGNNSGAPGSRGVFRDLKQLHSTLLKLQDVVKRKDKFDLLGMKSELEDLPNAIADLQAAVSGLATIRANIGLAILQGGPRAKVRPSRSWQARDTLHGSNTGVFLRALRELAASSDDNAKAFALGANVGYCTELCGSPYINSVVGAPYRNHWWRQRWISNYVDTWVWGYYSQGGAANVRMAGVVPIPSYTNWPNVGESQLHKRLQFSLDPDSLFGCIRDNTPVPSVLPQPFLDYWKKAYETAYGAPDPGSGIDDAGLQSAVAMTWLITWIQTSGELIPNVPPDQINYPDDCGPRPPWVAVDGSVTTGSAPPTQPPPASKDLDPTVAEIISGIVLAILGVFALLTGNVAAGIGAIIVAVALIADGATEPDWEQLRCYTGWVLAYYYNLTNALHDLLKWSGFGYPYTLELNHDDIAFSSGLITPADCAINTVRSQLPRGFPASRWAAISSNWARFPTEPIELPQQNAYPSDPTWPYHFVDGLEAVPPPPPPAPQPPPNQINPLFFLQNRPPLLRDGVEFAVRRANLNVAASTSNFFGNAVDVSMEVILGTMPEELLNWDLDGDAGIGYPTWVLPDATLPRSASVPE